MPGHPTHIPPRCSKIGFIAETSPPHPRRPDHCLAAGSNSRIVGNRLDTIATPSDADLWRPGCATQANPFTVSEGVEGRQTAELKGFFEGTMHPVASDFRRTNPYGYNVMTRGLKRQNNNFNNFLPRKPT